MRKNISLSIEEDDLKKLDDLCDNLSVFYRLKFSRTNAINFLVNYFFSSSDVKKIVPEPFSATTNSGKK